MKRSTINAILREADAFLKQHRFLLPPFAYWTPEDWAAKGAEARTIVARRLGWDITDFGLGDFEKNGLFLFTLRNGDLSALPAGRGMLYAEKIMIVDPDQVTPLHLHRVKTEDIINRGGGKLVIQLYHADADEGLAAADVTILQDGIARTVQAGDMLVLHPGESVTLPTKVYHAFWAADQRTLVGEVSLVNDDYTDNYFHEPIGRFPAIEEDEPPLYLLVNDYERYYRFV